MPPYSNLQQGVEARKVGMEAPANPTVHNTNQETIRRLMDVADSLEGLLAKVRGSQPQENNKCQEEMPSIMANAGKINSLAYKIAAQVNELHQIIGE